MTEKAVLEKEVNEIWQILISAKNSYQYCKYFYKPKTTIEVAYVNHSVHFIAIREALFKIVVIELNKLFSESSDDHFSLYKFIGRFGRKGLYKDLNIEDSVFRKWKSSLKANKTAISKVRLLRNKLYAHTDKDSDQALKIIVLFKEIETLIKIGEDIIRDVHSEIFESDTIFDLPHFSEKNFQIVKILAEAEAKRINDIRDSILKKKLPRQI